MTPLTEKLKRVYGKEPIKTDKWGRRPATPREIEAALNRDLFPILEQSFLPTEQDIKEKGDNG